MLTLLIYFAVFGGGILLWWIGSKVIDHFFGECKKKYKIPPFKSREKFLGEPLTKEKGCLRNEKSRKSYVGKKPN